MKRIIYVVISLLGITSCGTRGTIIDKKPIDELLSDFINVVEDPTSNWPTVKSVTARLVESLREALNDEDNRGYRLSSQRIAYETILATIDKYFEIQCVDGIEDDAGVDELVSRLGDAIFQWFSDNNEKYPNLWRDHFYVSDKEAENPIDGYFHLAVLLPTKENPQPSLHIIYPDAAEGCPMIEFRDFDEEGEEDSENGDRVLVEKWVAKGEVEDNSRMFSVSGPDIVEKMLEHEVMYISFIREHVDSDEDGGLEIARLSLAQFQAKWRETVDY